MTINKKKRQSPSNAKVHIYEVISIAFTRWSLDGTGTAKLQEFQTKSGPQNL